MKNNLSLSRILVVIGSIILIGALFLPIWRIELDAPQYPEGLVLQIYANRIAGDFEIINGLNHYIGMATLHTEDFIEFTILPYLIGGMILLGFAVAVLNRKKGYSVYFITFILFAVVSMVDFYRWLYNYGHNLDPNAPIQVPGMAYQPPLLGFKQLLNFGAFSIPDAGGWLFITAGVFSLAAFIFAIQPKWLKFKGNKMKPTVVTLCLMLVFASCSQSQQPIKYGTDNCDHCKMTIMNKHFGTQLVNKNGKTFKFDDLSCMLVYLKTADNSLKPFVADYTLKQSGLLEAEKAFFVKDPELKSPMAGNIAAFSSQADAENYIGQKQLKVMKWSEISTK